MSASVSHPFGLLSADVETGGTRFTFGRCCEHLSDKPEFICLPQSRYPSRRQEGAMSNDHDARVTLTLTRGKEVARRAAEAIERTRQLVDEHCDSDTPRRR